MLGFIKGMKTKTKIILVGVIILILLIIVANVQTAQQRKAEELAAQEEEESEYNAEEDLDESDYMSDEELEQQDFVEEFGEAPKGFRWDEEGNLVAVSDPSLTAEEVAYAYLKGLATLDFETAEKYSYDSKVIDNYKDLYNVEDDVSYYDEFLRKVYKECLTSMEVEKLEDSSVFANGGRIMNFRIKILDLTNKDFWTKDKNEIFKQLMYFDETQSDSTKARQYIYDYCLQYYQSDEASKHEVQVDLSIGKLSNSGFLVTDDASLNKLCSYEEGYLIADYIWDCFEEYKEMRLR